MAGNINLSGSEEIDMTTLDTTPEQVNPEIEIDIASLHLDPATQLRPLDEQTVADYVEAMKRGAKFPPIALVYDGSQYYSPDGAHRLEAHRRAGKAMISATIIKGTVRDAMLLAAGANAEHGLKRSNADKRRAVQVLLNDPEWSQFSNGKIAELCRVSKTFVAEVRASGVNVDTSNASETPIVRTGRDGKRYKTVAGSRRRQLNEVMDRCRRLREIADKWGILDRVEPILNTIKSSFNVNA
jgi:hypothetical protein